MLLANAGAHHLAATLRAAASAGRAAGADAARRAVSLRPSRAAAAHSRFAVARFAARPRWPCAASRADARLRLLGLPRRRCAARRSQRARRGATRRGDRNTHSAYLRSRGRRRLARSDQGRRRHARGAGHGRWSTPPGHGCATSTTTSGLSRRRRICASSKAATSWCRASPGPTTPTFAKAPTAASCSRIPYEERFTLIGTTEIGYSGDPAAASISGEEEEYLLALARQFFASPPARSDIVWSYCRRAPALR